ncbi:MAG: hypothetical protein M0Q43_08235, partial [Methanothrix sp.]|nr:hypothetical protein [Methanothrix sp.]
MDPEKLLKNFLKARRVIMDLFEKTWLESCMENELQKLWNRTDAIANTELLIFGDCLEKCIQISEARTKHFAKILKSSKDLNERRGAIYEIIVAGAYQNAGNSVIEFPIDPNNPGYDLKLIQN